LTFPHCPSIGSTGDRCDRPARVPVHRLSLRLTRWISLISTAVTLAALTAHAIELPNKLQLAAPLWLAVQQQLYRGWGAVFGPFEIAAIASTWVLAYLVRGRGPVFRRTLLAALLLSGALLAFFWLVAPVNAAVAAWTADALPGDWPAYRLRWELGHAAGFVLGLTAFVVLLRALCQDANARARRDD
jgi:hypothetical protein